MKEANKNISFGYKKIWYSLNDEENILEMKEIITKTQAHELVDQYM